MSLEEWSLMVGEIVAPFGIKGEAKVRLSTDFPDRFSRLRQVCLRLPNGTMQLWDVETARHHKEQVLLKLKGVNRIEDVELLRDAQVLIRATEAVRLPANEFYIHDLIGCEVVTEAGRVLGPLTGVLRGDAKAHDVYVIGEGKSEIMLPAI
jgi:16S rRNA processing protein RimM